MRIITTSSLQQQQQQQQHIANGKKCRMKQIVKEASAAKKNNINGTPTINQKSTKAKQSRDEPKRAKKTRRKTKNASSNDYKLITYVSYKACI